MSRREWTAVEPSLSAAMLDVIDSKLKYSKMAPVQAAVIPLFLQHKDVIVQAATGSGKSAAFLVPIFEMLQRTTSQRSSFEVGAIILSPTRELAQQIYSIAVTIAEHDTFKECRPILLTGGSSIDLDKDSITSAGGASILIGTPGKIESICNNHIGSLGISTKKLEVLVMDEADRLLDMGFHVSIQNILRTLPKQRRTGLFSATMTSALEVLANAGLRNPARIEVSVKGKQHSESAVPSSLQNWYAVVPVQDKFAHLVEFIKNHSDSKLIVFSLTRACVDYWSALLPHFIDRKACPIFGLHGSMVQKKRERIYESFVQSPKGVLLCTDVAARGIDIPDVDWIVQLDPPQDPSFYIHRVGRTARMGKAGQALLFLTKNEVEYIDFLSIKRVPLNLYHESTSKGDVFDAGHVQKTIQDLCMNDRDYFEKSQKAFVSFVRGYKEHHCDYIFQWKKVDYAALALGFGLVWFPRMKDLQGIKIDFTNLVQDRDAITFKDPQREKQRLANLSSVVRKRQEVIDKRRQDYDDSLKKRKEASKLRSKRKKSKNVDMRAEWDELAEENRELKKAAKKKRQGSSKGSI